MQLRNIKVVKAKGEAKAGAKPKAKAAAKPEVEESKSKRKAEPVEPTVKANKAKK